MGPTRQHPDAPYAEHAVHELHELYELDAPYAPSYEPHVPYVSCASWTTHQHDTNQSGFLRMERLRDGSTDDEDGFCFRFEDFSYHFPVYYLSIVSYMFLLNTNLDRSNLWTSSRSCRSHRPGQQPFLLLLLLVSVFFPLFCHVHLFGHFALFFWLAEGFSLYCLIFRLLCHDNLSMDDGP